MTTHTEQTVRRVLVVDDDPRVRGLLHAALTGAGYAVLSAANGAQALSLLAGDPAGPLHAVLLDLDMPAMGGVDFARAYRQRPGPHAPIVVLSGAVDAPERARAAGADALLPKPFSVRGLLRVLAALPTQ